MNLHGEKGYQIIKEFERIYIIFARVAWFTWISKPTNIFLDNNFVPNIADFCLSSCLEENQNQAIASKQFGSMWSIEIVMDSSLVVQVSSLMPHDMLH
jgi:hypothetical protein